MPHLLPCFLALLLLCGCVTNNSLVFHGRVENLAGDGWVEEGTRAVGGMSSKPGPEGGRMLSLPLEHGVSFVLLHPAVETGKTLRAHSANAELRAWLLHDPKPIGGIPIDGHPESGSAVRDFDLSKATPLSGDLVLRWRNNLDFVLRVNVRSEGTNASALFGEFEMRHQVTFEPNMVWVAPAMLMGAGMATTKTIAQQNDPNRFTKPGSLVSVDKQIGRLMKTRRHHRGFGVKSAGTDESLEFSNDPTLLDQPGVHMELFVTKKLNERLRALKQVCEASGIRWRMLPVENEESILRLDIYGKPSAVAGTAKELLRAAFGINESAALEFRRLD